MMTDQELAGLAELESKMTPGPWTRGCGETGIFGAVGMPVTMLDGCFELCDADGIIALRNAAPQLLAELRELRAYKERREAERCETCRLWYGGHDLSAPGCKSPSMYCCADWMAREGEP